MIRWLFTVASVLSLLLCVAVLVLWVRGYWVGDRWDWSLDRVEAAPHTAVAWCLINAHGSLGLARTSFATPRLPADWPHLHRRTFHHRSEQPGRLEWGPPVPINVPLGTRETLANWQWAGVQYLRCVARNKYLVGNETAVALPAGVLVAFTAAGPLVYAWTALRRWRRRRSGHCETCAYDLRASTGRCPECGMAIPQNVGAKS
jgi:hypothetical protein